MRYHNITKDDMLNGDGLRVVLWVAGCAHHCPGCHNPVTWDENAGLFFDEGAQQELILAISKDYISGLTISGGDPLFIANRDDVLRLVKAVKLRFPDKTIWIYTGFIWEEVQDLEILEYVDVLVDGRFVEQEKDVKAFWRGSSNQRVIDVRATRMAGAIVLHCK